MSPLQQTLGTLEKSFESADFPGHMEPMMLACIQNNYEIINLMLQKGHRLEMPNFAEEQGIFYFYPDTS